jgi:hypothetical protein
LGRALVALAAEIEEERISDAALAAEMRISVAGAAFQRLLSPISGG